MNRVQKLPVSLLGACFSALAVMSSCSKEDSVAPQPEISAVSVKSEDGAKFKSNALPVVHPTQGQICQWCLPDGYSLKNQNGVIGLSNANYLFGNTATPWIHPIRVSADSPQTFLTVGSTKDNGGQVGIYVSNLVYGQKYSFTYRVSTMSVKNASGLGQSPYAYSFHVKAPSGGPLAYKNTYLAGKENKWITETIEFTHDNANATTGEIKILLSNFSNAVAYGNIHIPADAIKLVNQ
ncbi:hypothetical protein FEM33_09820 [Dyadobacter flavalbus]|uniref:CBM-cenC domain-containing protein n=1 Tax=Dyadobacter flavalbus TaxID=2579942 RepID=A0A5M8QV16_9BACT|nr:hypothetical protein [Dyadobacter flavalbus]KAA6439989.1 hypothetical protein FEM33_09820 [Dyadobacter flavalbus]